MPVCAITWLKTKEGEDDVLQSVVPIAGELKGAGGSNLDAKSTRLKTSTSTEKEGLRLEMNGGFKNKRPQKAIIEFICDKNRTGLENIPTPEDEYDGGNEKREESDAEKMRTPSLEFVQYGPDDDNNVDILRLNWRTKYACEDYKQEQDAQKGEHWGFFTWFIIV